MSAFEVDGGKELRAQLKRFEGGMKDLKTVHKRSADLVAADAKPRARHKSGAMAASVRAAGQASQGVVRAGFARLNYVPIQVFGSPKQGITPNPFPYDALDARFSDVVQVFETNLEKVKSKYGLD